MIRSAFLVAVSAVVLAAGASAAPVVTDPNFNQTTTTSPYYYGIEAWGATTNTSSPYYNNNQSFAGNVAFDTNNQFNNGTPGNGQAKVGFIANNGYISQSISGFVVGTNYVITLLANGRVTSPTSNAVLEIDVGANAPAPAFTAAAPAGSQVVFSGAETPVNAVGVQTNSFRLVTSNVFAATSTTMLVTLQNTGSSDSSLLLSGFAIQQAAAVPEPVSLALLGTGLAAVAVLRRRRR